MADEDGFLNALRANPADDTIRLVYADWLEERGDTASVARAEFLRLVTVRPAPANRKGRKDRTMRLKALATGLDTHWLAVVSKLTVENCGRQAAEVEDGYALRFDFVCDRRWEELSTTVDDGIRHCAGCNQDVHYCETINEARSHAWQGHCIAVDLGVIRRARDLEPEDGLGSIFRAREIESQSRLMGLPILFPSESERERIEPDA
jgi:uncharacterized protein (TIGR02996 family)